MMFPPYRIGDTVRALKQFERKTGLCATANVSEGETGGIRYYWSSGKFIVEWPGVLNRPQTVHEAEDWGVIVGAVERTKTE